MKEEKREKEKGFKEKRWRRKRKKKRGVKYWGLYFGAEAVKLRTAKRKNIPVK